MSPYIIPKGLEDIPEPFRRYNHVSANPPDPQTDMLFFMLVVMLFF